MSQELAQDEAEADAEDYEIDALENGHQRLATHDDEDEEGHELVKRGGPRGDVREENVVFAMGEDSDDEGSGEGSGEESDRGKRAKGYRDVGHERASDSGKGD